MLREFINCKNTEERINYIVNSKASDWTESEIAAVMEIVGVNGDYSDTPAEDKLNIIAATLEFAKKAVANDNTIFTKLDDAEEHAQSGLTQEEKERMELQYARFVSHYYAKSANCDTMV